MEFKKERLYFLEATETNGINTTQFINIDGKSHYFDTTDRGLTTDKGFYIKESDLIKIMPKGCSSIKKVQFVGYVYGVD